MGTSSGGFRDDSRLGTILNERYKIVDRIAAGGMGVVYKAERLQLGRPVAIKFLHELYIEEEKMRARFEREAKAMSKLDHPFCVSVIDFGVEGSPYIVMDFAEGRTLKAVLKRERFSITRAIRVARQLLAALDHAHNQKIIHRDIKPSNIKIQTQAGVGETIRIFDFGLAKLLDPEEDRHVGLSSSVVIGTPNYMSPEQSIGETVDHRTDLYSTGCVLFEMLTGRKPFSDDHAIEVLRMHRTEPPPTLNEACSDVDFSPQIEAVVNKALAKSPDERFQSATEFAEALSSTPEAGLEEMSRQSGYADMHSRSSDASGIKEPRRGGGGGGGGGVKSFFVTLVVAMFVVAGVIALWRFGLLSEWFRRFELVTAVTADGDLETDTDELIFKLSEVSEFLETSQVAELKEDDEGTDDEAIVVSFEDVKKLSKAGRTTDAIRALVKLRRLHPDNPYYALYLGNLYFVMKWWSDGLDAYQNALRLKPDYKNRAVLNRNIILTLQGDRVYRRSRHIISSQIGKPAIPFLKEAVQRSSSTKVRKRARALLEQMKK